MEARLRTHLGAALMVSHLLSGILFSTLLFGFASALAIQLQGSEILPAVLVQAFPYVVTVLVLAGFIGKSRPPAAVGKPYEK